MLKSLEKLRKKLEEDTAPDFVFTTYPEQHGFRADVTVEGYEAIADEIEREVSERYEMRPIDADDVPIHVGDKMPNGTVSYIWDFGRGWEVVLNDWSAHRPCDLHHYHEPTAEDVLQEFAEALYGATDKREEVFIISKYAKKLHLAETEEI